MLVSMVIGKVRVHETDISWCRLNIRRNKMCSNAVISLLSIFVNIEYIICRFLYSLQSGYRKYIYSQFYKEFCC